MGLFDPRIEKHLIADQGEVVIDEVHKHWAATVGAMLELFAGAIVLLVSLFVPDVVRWLPAVAGAAIVLHASWRTLEQKTDRFVITNMRVFRVHGILSRNIATMPLSRILDISVHTPIVGRVFGYGHFVFESAAQEQGLHAIRFVGDPDARGLTIQRVIQQAGLRGFIPGQQLTAAEVPPDLPPVPPLPPAAMRPAVVPPAPMPPKRPAQVARRGDAGWEWLADAQRRETERLAELRGEPVARSSAPFDPDRAVTAPLDLPR